MEEPSSTVADGVRVFAMAGLPAESLNRGCKNKATQSVLGLEEWKIQSPGSGSLRQAVPAKGVATAVNVQEVRLSCV